MEKVLSSWFDGDGNLQFVGEEGTVLWLEGKGIVDADLASPPQIPMPVPAPPNEMEYHWYQDGEDLEVRTGQVNLTNKIISAQAFYRSGIFSGYVLLDKSSPDDHLPLEVRPVGGHIPFENGGLASAGLVYGTGYYHNKSKHDGFPCLVQWVNYGLRFHVATSKDSDKVDFVKKGYPTNWPSYGLFLSWSIAVP